jgi:hypothetical protein
LPDRGIRWGDVLAGQRQLVVVARIWSTTRRRVNARRGNATGFGAGMLDMNPSSAHCERVVNIRLR